MSTPSSLAIVFWTCFSAVLFAYLGYPILIFVLSRVFGRRLPIPSKSDEGLPSISLLIAAHNEEIDIEARILNALALDYPADRLEIVIASDGSTDRTNEIVRRYADRGVLLFAYEKNRGKATVLNESVPQLSGEIVLLSDANTEMASDAARRLASWFVDANVGVVCGRLDLTDPRTGRNVDGLYWKYETFLKKCESRLRRTARLEWRDLRHPQAAIPDDSPRHLDRRLRHSSRSQTPIGLPDHLRFAHGGERGNRADDHGRVPPARPDWGGWFPEYRHALAALVAEQRVGRPDLLLPQDPALGLPVPLAGDVGRERAPPRRSAL